MLPKYFYDAEGIVTLEAYGNRPRWYDEYADPQGESRLILTPKELRGRAERDRAYRDWQKLFAPRVRPSIMKWQMIRVLDVAHPNRSRSDWWREYREAVFRVFVNPHYEYDRWHRNNGYYILAPEECFLVHAWEAERRGYSVPRRSSFKYVCPVPEFREMLIVPVVCCKHMRHETTAGQLPVGL